MVKHVLVLAVLLGLQLPLGVRAADNDRVVHEGTAQLRSETELTIRLMDGELHVLPLKTIGRLDAVPPGGLIRLTKTTAVPGTAKELAKEALRLEQDAKVASEAAAASAGGAAAEAASKAQLARAAADAGAEAAAIARDNERPLQASVIGAQLVGTIQQIADDQSWVVVRAPQPAKRPWPATWSADAVEAAALSSDSADKGVLVSIQVGTALRTLVKSMRPGDGVRAVYQKARSDASDAAGADSVPSINTLKQLEWRKVRATRGLPFAIFLVSALLLLAVAIFFTKGSPSQIFLGEDNRYSTSKFQTVLWFWIVISTYLAIAAMRWAYAGMDYIGGIDIPTSLLVLSGLSVLGATGAKLITTNKVETAKAAAGADPDREPKPAADKARPSDLINDDLNRTDLGDFQLVTVTGIAAVMYVVSAVEFMAVIELRRVVTMPEVDSTLLALFGLSQAGYLGKKIAGDAGAGMTDQQAIERADLLGAAIKASMKKVESAANEAADKVNAVKVAAGVAKNAPTKVAAQESLARAKATSEAVGLAENDAIQTLKSLKAQVVDLGTLAATWSKDTTVKPRTDAVVAAARVDQTKAESSCKDTIEAAKQAKGLVDEAQSAVDAKPT